MRLLPADFVVRSFATGAGRFGVEEGGHVCMCIQMHACVYACQHGNTSADVRNHVNAGARGSTGTGVYTQAGQHVLRHIHRRQVSPHLHVLDSLPKAGQGCFLGWLGVEWVTGPVASAHSAWPNRPSGYHLPCSCPVGSPQVYPQFIHWLTFLPALTPAYGHFTLCYPNEHHSME